MMVDKTEEELLALAQKMNDVLTDNNCTQGEGMKIFACVIYPTLMKAPNKSITMRGGVNTITFSCTGVPDGNENDNS